MKYKDGYLVKGLVHLDEEPIRVSDLSVFDPEISEDYLDHDLVNTIPSEKIEEYKETLIKSAKKFFNGNLTKKEE